MVSRLGTPYQKCKRPDPRSNSTIHGSAMLNGVRTALVTGATGFIGSALVSRLSSESVRTFCPIRRQTRDRNKIERLPNVEILESTDSGQLDPKVARISPDVVFNLASAGVNPSERDALKLLEGNLSVLVQLIYAVRSTRPKCFIHIGSCSEY